MKNISAKRRTKERKRVEITKLYCKKIEFEIADYFYLSIIFNEIDIEREKN